ncbi:MAG: ABC transporter permease [Chloroflexota bacterium]
MLSPALLVMTLFFVGSMLILFALGFQPFVGGHLTSGTTAGNYLQFLGGGYYWGIVATTMKLGALTAALCAVVGYPVAYALEKIRRPLARNAVYFIIFSPLMTSVVVRSYGWMLILGDDGFINSTLKGLHLIGRPIPLLFQFSGVTISLVHILLPFMVFPILSVLSQLEPSLKQAAADLGASGWETFRRVTFPLTVQGVIAGCELVFALSISAFATPSLLGGGRVQVLASLIYSDVGTLNWPLASVESYVLLALAIAAIAIFNRLLRAQSPRQATAS